MGLQLEVNSAFTEAMSAFQMSDGSVLAFTPPITSEYWLLRVPLSEKQAIVAFPKFFTIGVGFQVEEDLNTNLPYTCEAREIFDHIAHNKGDDAITDDDCVAAIRLIQSAAKALEEHE